MGTDYFADRVNLSKHDAGTVVAFNVETGEYLAAPTQEAALDAFERAFGWGVPAQIHVVGERAAHRDAAQDPRSKGRLA